MKRQLFYIKRLVNLKEHNKEPKINSHDPLERRMAEAIIFLKNKKRNQSN